MKQRLLMVLVALDIFLFAMITLGHCQRGETMSAAAWSLELRGKLQGRIFRPVIDWLFSWWKPGHCAAAWRYEKDLYPKG